jgi:hypothetical protein
MSSDAVTLVSLEKTLESIFNTDRWTNLQNRAYQTLSRYVKNHHTDHRNSIIRDDKVIIRRNFSNQAWFIHSPSKPIISHLLDHMTLTNYVCDQTPYQTNLLLLLSFKVFTLHGGYYHNLTTGLLNFYLFFEPTGTVTKKQRAYLTYYSQSTGQTPIPALSQLKLPEFDKIYAVTGLNSNVFPQYDLLSFFHEIVMYYDESGHIGQTPIGHQHNITLNQLLEKFNTYVKTQHQNIGYQVLKAPSEAITHPTPISHSTPLSSNPTKSIPPDLTGSNPVRQIRMTQN